MSFSKYNIVYDTNISLENDLSDLFIFKFLRSSNFQNIVSNCDRMHNLATSF